MQAENPPPPNPARWWIRGTIAVCVVAVVVVAVASIPRGFDTDLSKIGDGKRALVFIYDNNLLVSNQQTRQMDEVRVEQGEAMHFLIASTGHPDTPQFMRDHQARPTELLLFSAEGALLHKAQSLMSAEQLRALLQDYGN